MDSCVPTAPGPEAELGVGGGGGQHSFCFKVPSVPGGAAVLCPVRMFLQTNCRE